MNTVSIKIDNDIKKHLVGVDLGGTNVRAGNVFNGNVTNHYSQPISSTKQSQIILNEVINAIANVIDDRVEAIGIGVPSMVDVKNGVVYDVQNIPSWKKLNLREAIEKEFKIPVLINNDANCFALGEKYFGQAKNYRNVVGLVIGTGIGSGIILDNKLYNGRNCTAGEFGMISYLNHDYEYYCSGQFFKNKHNTSGEALHKMAAKGDKQSLQVMFEFGKHVGNAIRTIILSVDPDVIVFGGSVSKSFPYFVEGINHSLQDFPYPQAIKNIAFKISDNPQVAVLGAASLYFEHVI